MAEQEVAKTSDILEALEQLRVFASKIPQSPYRRLDRAVSNARIALGKAATIATVAAQRERKRGEDTKSIDCWLWRQSYGKVLLMSYGVPLPADYMR